jgi:hypothetical protein
MRATVMLCFCKRIWTLHSRIVTICTGCVSVSVCLREFSPTTISRCLPIKRLVLVTKTQYVVCDVGELRPCRGEVRNAEAALALHRDRDMSGDNQNIGHPNRTGPDRVLTSSARKLTNQHTRFVCPVFSVINSHFHKHSL